MYVRNKVSQFCEIILRIIQFFFCYLFLNKILYCNYVVYFLSELLIIYYRILLYVYRKSGQDFIMQRMLGVLLEFLSSDGRYRNNNIFSYLNAVNDNHNDKTDIIPKIKNVETIFITT